MVRLKDDSSRIEGMAYHLFQFPNGSIKRPRGKVENRFSPTVSIP